MIFTLLAFLFLGTCFLSLWVNKNIKIWGTLLALSILCGLIAHHISWVGLLFIILLASLWFTYAKKPHPALFVLVILCSALFKLRLLPGYTPYAFTSKFAIGLEGPLVGLFPLAFLVPLAKTIKDWTAVIKGLLIGCTGIAILAILATISKATHWHFSLPSFATARILSNLFLTSIPEEGLYRGFIQNTLSSYLKNIKLGKILALVITSILFTAAHVYWSPNLSILAFVFLSSLLYGSVYLISKKIESAILCHFLLNFIHMTFFSYHAI